MTYEEKVAWLRRYRQALRDEVRLRDRIKAVRSRAESTTQALRPVVGGGSQDGTKIERGAELLDQYQRELQEQLKASEQIRVEIEASINALHSALQRDVLQARYIDGLPVWRTANRLNISERWVLSNQARAIENLQIVHLSSPFEVVN